MKLVSKILIAIVPLVLVVVAIFGIIVFPMIDPAVKLVNATDQQIVVSVRQGPVGNAPSAVVEPFGEYSFNPNSDHGFYLFVSRPEDTITNCSFEIESCCDLEKPSCKISGLLSSAAIEKIYYSNDRPLKTETRYD